MSEKSKIYAKEFVEKLKSGKYKRDKISNNFDYNISWRERIYCIENSIDIEDLLLKRELQKYKRFLQTSNFDYIEEKNYKLEYNIKRQYL